MNRKEFLKSCGGSLALVKRLRTPAFMLAFLLGVHPLFAQRVLGDVAPGTKPKIFAPGVFTLPERYEQYSCFSRDGKEYYLSITDDRWNYLRILRSEWQGDKWGPLEPVSFARDGRTGGEPFITCDNQELYFVSDRHHETPWHSEIYKVRRTKTGWSEPIRLPAPINSKASQWHPTLTKDGTIYFGSEREGGALKADIYFSRLEGGEYKTVHKLGGLINTAYNDCDPLIAPDESWLIFHSDRPGGFGEHDLYISYRQKDGTWSDPKNMGPDINTAQWEMGPALSADGKYLFFTRRKAFYPGEPSKVFWVDASIIDKLRK